MFILACDFSTNEITLLFYFSESYLFKIKCLQYFVGNRTESSGKTRNLLLLLLLLFLFFHLKVVVGLSKKYCKYWISNKKSYLLRCSFSFFSKRIQNPIERLKWSFFR